MSKDDFFRNTSDEGSDFPLVRLWFRPKLIKNPDYLFPKADKQNATAHKPKEKEKTNV